MGEETECALMLKFSDEGKSVSTGTSVKSPKIRSYSSACVDEENTKQLEYNTIIINQCLDINFCPFNWCLCNKIVHLNSIIQDTVFALFIAPDAVS